MFDPTEAPSPFQLRQAGMDDFAFAEALTRNNMGGYYRRHNLVWRGDLFLGSWRESENFILEVRRRADRRDAHDARKAIRCISATCRLPKGSRGTAPAPICSTSSHQWARERGLREWQLRVFVDNPGWRGSISARATSWPGSRLAQLGAIRHMARRV